MKQIFFAPILGLMMVGAAQAASVTTPNTGPSDVTPKRIAVTVQGPDLPTMLGLVGRSPMYSAEFIRAAPVIAAKCDMKVVKSELLHTVERFDDVDILPAMLHHIDANNEENHILTAWYAGMDKDAGRMCAFATKLWGEDGVQFPGLMAPYHE